MKTMIYFFTIPSKTNCIFMSFCSYIILRRSYIMLLTKVLLQKIRRIPFSFSFFILTKKKEKNSITKLNI